MDSSSTRREAADAGATSPGSAFLLAHDWSQSSLGPPSSWAATLRSAVALIFDSPDPMWLAWGSDLAMVYNEPYAALLGGKHPQAMGAPLQTVWREVWPDVEALVAAALSGQTLFRDDLRLMVNRNGVHEPAWFSFTYTPALEDGVVRGLSCVVLETTEKMLASHRLADAESRYRLAVLATNDAIWDWNLATGQVIWNRALATLFGHELEQTSAQWWIDHIHPQDRSRIDAGIHAVIEGDGVSWTGEYRFRRADGSWADIYDRGTVQRNAQGEPLRMIGAMLDLSERKAVAAALHESERRFQTLFESIDEGFCIIEFLDGPEGPLSDYVHIAANPAYLANAGIANVVGQRLRQMVSPSEADGWVDFYRKVLLSGEPIRFERELVETGRYLALSSFRVEPPELRQVAVLFQDVTKRHRAEVELRMLNESLERRVAEEVEKRLRTEEVLRQSQKMEAVGQLAGGIAHDFNNMLAVVSGSLDLLSMKFVKDEPRAKRYVDSAKDATRRAAQLTQRLLAFSRQQPLQPENIDINKLVAGMSDLLRHSLGGAYQLETVLAGGVWRVHADPNQLENVILNLAVNGRDAMSDGGRLTIETSNAHLDERYVTEHVGLPVGQYVMVAVSDTGAGMSPEVAARAFDPFFTTKDVGRGTGLGLSQVYGFVKQSGGHVKIYSELGQGTAVKIYLPRLVSAAQEESEAQSARDAPMGDRREVILVVEDEPAVRQMSVDALTALGYTVLEADGAANALKLLDAHPEIELLFTDVVMPQVNGRKLADEARKRRPELKVLFTTGYTRNAVVHNGVLDPGVQLIGKPFTVEDLAARVRELLDSTGG